MLGVREVRVGRRGEVEHRRAPHVLEQRRVHAVEQRLEEDALAQAGLGDLERLEAARLHHACTTSAPARIRSPRAALIPGTDARSEAGSSASRSISVVERLARDREALDAVGRQLGRELGGGGEVADRAADADQAPAALEPVAPRRAARATCSRSALICLPFARSPGRKRSVMRTAPSGHERASVGEPALDARELHRAAAEVERDAVGQRRRVDRRQVAVARLLLAREHLDLEARCARARLQELALVGGVADRRGRDRAGRPRCRWRGRSARRARASRARAPSARAASSPSASRPSPIRTASWISSVRRHHAWPVTRSA